MGRGAERLVMSAQDASQQIFQRLKPVCVPLLGSSLLTPSTIPNALNLLAELIVILRDIKASGNALNASLISYTFFPLSTILSRNKSAEIPDQVLEKIFIVFKILCEDWWWSCDIKLWEQIFVLCGSVIGDIEGKGKGKKRDEETKAAAAHCLFALLHPRDEEEAALHSGSATTRLSEFQANASSPRFTPILGQTLDSLLTTATSQHLSLQLISLELLHILISTYFPDTLITSVLPGVVSSMTKLVQGVPGGLGWAKGATVCGALKVMQTVIVKSIGDDVCVRDGAVRYVEDLEDLADLLNPQPGESSGHTESFSTARTSSWLRGTSSQLHIALNTLTPLVSHTTLSALLALVNFSSAIIAATTLTLPQSRPLLLSFLLSLSISSFSDVSARARSSLLALLTTQTKARQPLLQTLIHSTRDNISALPRLLSSQTDSKVEHVAGLIEAVCSLAAPNENTSGIASISSGLGVLLGPTGGIERWGWRLLSVLELVEPPFVVSRTSAAQLMLENETDGSDGTAFPELTFKNVSTRSAYEALVRMFHSLGRAAGDSGLSAVEWFADAGQNGASSLSVAAMWCACRLLEGAADVSILSGYSGDPLAHKRSQRLEKMARTLAKSVAELWDHTEDLDASRIPVEDDADIPLTVQHVKGLDSLQDTLKIVQASSTKPRNSTTQPTLHRTLCLQLLAVLSGVLQARSTPLLIYTLYPVLHSLVSPVLHLSSTALATLIFMATSASYASPANLLLSNFDYALDAVARRLTRRWLDVDATKVLVVLVRLVGPQVVAEAGDVVEECFDRLDEFHGYDVIVEGLIEVLGEVIKVIEVEEAALRGDAPRPTSPSLEFPRDNEVLQGFFAWFPRRHETLPLEDLEPPDPEPTSQPSGSPEQQPSSEDPPSTPTQILTKQIVTRSLYFLTHGSSVIRARILSLLAASVPVLPESALLPSIHSAWPFILNRLADSETFVVAAAASLIEALVTHVGSFMYRRMWNDVWPRFHTMLTKLDTADATNALSRRGRGSVGTESAYTHSHRLYRSLLKSMTATMKGVRAQDTSVWQAVLSFRRFLHRHTHDELQRCAREFYIAASAQNADVVWLALTATMATTSNYPTMAFLRESKWDIEYNVEDIFRCMNA
ncbi:Heat repeat protein [Mycena sanguinolenta]|uniref:Heat repeat protein n=1 Tax=Mycena sanguinolenta TaxID=230812 RepID=A0A8H6ZI08_9AGAR|nr:Heat repeat protein [Mycena sanguinolenta]